MDETSHTPPPNRLHYNAAWAITGNICYTLGRVAIFSLLAKAWSSDQVGQLIFALSVVSPLSFLINLEIRSIYVTDPTGQIVPGLCLATRLVTNTVLLAVLTVLAADFYWRDGSVAAWLIFTCGVVRVMDTWGDVYLGVMQKSEQMKLWARSQIYKTALVLVWLAFMWVLSWPIVMLPIGWAGCAALVIWFYDRPTAARLETIKLTGDLAQIKALLKKALPLGIFVTVTSLNISIAPMIIKAHLNESQVAYYGVMMMFISGLCAIQNGMNHSILPRLSSYFLTSRQQFWKLLGTVMGLTWAVMGVIIAVVWWQGATILQILFKEEYAQQANLFFLIIIGGWLTISGMTLGDAVIAVQRFQSRMLAVILGLIINGSICWIGIPKAGLKAAAWASIAAPAGICVFCICVLLLNCTAVKSNRRGQKQTEE